MNKQQIIWFLYSFGLFFLGSFGHWYIMYWQFKMENWIKTPWPYLLAPVEAFLWILASHYGVKAFGGEMWSNRFLFFVTGVCVAAILSISFWATIYSKNTYTTYTCGNYYISINLMEIIKY